MRTPTPLLLLCGLALSSSAEATPNFPAEVARALSVPEPSCTLCHQTPAGGSGTVGQPFGLALLERGVMPYDTDGLAAALRALESEQVDSDRDGMGDVAELKEGRNPNRADAANVTTREGNPGTGGSSPGAPEEELVPQPDYGCGVAGNGLSAGACAALLAAALVRPRPVNGWK